MADESSTSVEMAEIHVTTISNKSSDIIEPPQIESPVSDEVEDKEAPVTASLMRKRRAWTRYGLRDRGKSAKTLSEEWWQGKEPLVIRGKTVPVFIMKWFLFLKYEEPPKHISILQQSAWAWRPRLNFWCVFPILCTTCLFFIIFGIPMVYFLVTGVFTFSTDYTHCVSTNSSSELKSSIDQMLTQSSIQSPCVSPVNLTNINITTCDQYISAIPRCVLASVRINFLCVCSVELQIDRDLSPPVFLFYELTNFYISHRRFTQSWFGSHFLSQKFDSVDSGCAAYSRNANGTIYFPCGMVTNAFFNDTISPLNFTINKRDITFSRYVGNKFVQPSLARQEEILNATASPAAWPFSVYSLSGGMENEDFMAWHSTSAFPNFRKLYGVINGTITAKTYTFHIVYSYPVTSVGASKFISIATTAWMGGQPSGFLSYSFLIFGILIALTTLLIVVFHFPLKHIHKKDYLQQPY